MLRIILSGLVISASLALQSTGAAAIPVSFYCLSGNSGTNCATGEAELVVEAVDLGGSQVRFDFTKSVADGDWSITDVYFDDGTLLGIATIAGTPGVDFAQYATPGNLPAGASASPAFVTTAGFSLDSNTPMLPANGVDQAGETLSVTFNLMGGGTFADIQLELSNGDLRIGLHVQSFGNGGSESFINNPIPEPGTALLMGLGLAGLAIRRR